MSRLPQPGSDTGIWGHVLNDYLLVEHAADGKLRSDGSLAGKVDASGGGKEVVRTATVSGTLTVNLGQGNVHMVTLTAHVTVAFTGATAGRACSVSLYMRQDATGSRVVTWPASVKWPGGVPPILSVNANAIDLVVLETIDGGTTWFGALAGADYR